MYPVNEVLHTSYGVNLISGNFLRLEWEIETNTVKDIRLTAATEKVVTLGGAVRLYARLVDPQVRVWFVIVESISVNILFLTVLNGQVHKIYISTRVAYRPVSS